MKIEYLVFEKLAEFDEPLCVCVRARARVCVEYLVFEKLAEFEAQVEIGRAGRV